MVLTMFVLVSSLAMCDSSNTCPPSPIPYHLHHGAGTRNMEVELCIGLRTKSPATRGLAEGESCDMCDRTSRFQITCVCAWEEHQTQYIEKNDGVG